MVPIGQPSVLVAPWLVLLLLTGWQWSTTAADPTAGSSTLPLNPEAYEFRQLHDPEGIGKFYLGREIADVMGHEGADWLERPEREPEEKPGLLVESLRLKPGEVVADVGAGSGYFSSRLARAVGLKGRVYAVDVQQEMLKLLVRSMANRQISNVVPVLGTLTNARLPSHSVDLALLVDVYHEFSHPHEMVDSLCQALKPGGRLVLVEYRGEDANVPIKRLHKMTEAQVRQEMALHPISWEETIGVLPRQHILVFRKNR